MYFLASVEVRYKKSVLEPQGEAIRLALNDKFSDGSYSSSVGISTPELQNCLESIRVGKLIELRLQAENADNAMKIVQKITDDLLYNSVMETAQIHLSEEPQG